MKITVYLGANEGNDPSLKEAVKELGIWIGENGHTLVYGDSKTGLMGELAGSVLEAGGSVIGVEPQMFIEQGIQVSLLSNARNGETGEETVVYGASGLAHLNNVNTVLAGLDLSFSVREFKDIIKEMQNGVYGEDYRAVPGSTNMTYIMISQNRRENLKESYRQLTGGISGNVSGGAGMWIVPYFIDEREEVFPAGMTDSMDFTAWEVDRNDG